MPHHNCSDEEMINLLKQNNIVGWQILYAKYAGIMYGAILRVIDDKKIAEEIFIHLFTTLKTIDFLEINKKSFLLFLLHHTHCTLSAFVTTKGIKTIPINYDNEFSPLVKCLLYESCTVKDLAKKLAINEAEITTRLRFEIIQVRKNKKLFYSL